MGAPLEEGRWKSLVTYAKRDFIITKFTGRIG